MWLFSATVNHDFIYIPAPTMSEKCDVRKCKWKTLRTSILNPHFLEQSATSSSQEICILSITFLPRYHETTWKNKTTKIHKDFCESIHVLVGRLNMQSGSAISHFDVHIFCFLFMIEFSLGKKGFTVSTCDLKILCQFWRKKHYDMHRSGK